MLEGKERKYCPKCDFVDYKNPLPVALAIAVKDKDFLLIKRGLPPRQGMWASPSGFIEIGETAEEACLRELKEETGVSGEILKLVGVIRRKDKEVYGDMLIVEYLVKVANEELKPGSDVEDVRFFSVDELPDYYANFFREVIEEVQNKI
jgi:ADP-ribose pyrophosphatase YjhB (NUDIX family)